MATTTMAPPALVAAPARVPLPGGLFSVLTPRPEGDGRWQAGVEFVTSPCPELGGIGAPTCSPAGSEGQPEIQMLTVEGPPTSGTWRVGYHGVWYGPFPIDATAQAVEDIINASTMQYDVTVTGAAGGPWTVTSDDPRPFDLLITDDTFDVGGVEVDLVQEGQYPATLGLPKTLDPSGLDEGTGSPFTVYGHFRCSPVGWSVSEAQDKANADLLQSEEFTVERAFWEGSLGNVPNLAGNVNGYGPLVLDPAGDITEAVASLETYLGEVHHALGIIHMSRAAAVLALADKVIENKSGRLFTLLGTPVVAGSGYTGKGPGDEAPEFMYATGPMFVYRSDVFTSANREGDLFDRARNDLTAIAERTYTLGVDTCGHAVVEVTP